MSLDDIPLFGMLRSRLGYLNQRQKVVAQNIANSDTPGYRPEDLTAFSFKAHLANQAGPVRPSAIGGSAPHMLKVTTSSGGAPVKATPAPDSETTLDGNQVVLEEQMMKLTDARMNYDAAIGFYQKSLSLLRMAARAPGR